MKKAILLIMAIGFTLPAIAQYDWGAQSKVETKTIKSQVLDAERDYNIFLPKSYDTEKDRKYPILYLLHGMMGNNKDWFERGYVKDVMDQLVASGEACEMIIVSPNAGGNIYEGVWNGYFDMPGWKYETFFYTEFLPHIESTYRVIADKAHRAVAGLSMGGGGATCYAQRHSDMFSSAYAMSALMSIPEQGAAPSQSPDDKMAILTKSVIEHSCVKYVEEADDARKEQLRSVVWFVDCGDDDFLLDRNIEFTQAMRKAQIPCQFRVRDGGHTWEYWHSALYTCLPFVTRNFGK
ncbi:enterochelin esterase-like enzyme [Parabacteroides sp. PH5-13]|uniref:alpha/beta hydrolase n=1 Tax=unclassified Parabacteroides TaxID=2649774 RepID=UPI0024734141|nr:MULTISPECIES: alpha/beta hydrolase-fold protein [unclassified Parabacteroides]MDH6304696.1 enterochelin esterase-like enzyme [Parabacteroides sp. PH5-39]MDH6319350.1 enterochelin esterase-like enzyme [Parabacteroides sp. PH5-13]MDH6323081.1 enterochelin esterase-like enzyme [Parabacteroides sp. PH5-8]MDH6384197.1 enterochelin esterase-like enzyme [Parabacteroides sp. PH5-17]MDH6393315.1 enterochelin esterase-like enzyme [Parabacteroides sp. PFB2-22]